MLDETIIRYNGVERLAYLMYTQDFWTPVPYILYILKNVESKRERDNIFSYMETYLMRRLICKSKNNSYSDMFSENLIGQGVNTFEALLFCLLQPSLCAPLSHACSVHHLKDYYSFVSFLQIARSIFV